MSQLRLWGQPRSINVQKVLWALDELGLEYERIDAGGSFGRVKDADGAWYARIQERPSFARWVDLPLS